MQNKKRLVKSVCVGTAVSLLADLILICAAAAVFLSVGLPQNGSILDYSMIAAAALGAFAGGFTAAKINNGAALIVGLLTGLLSFAVITAVAVLRGGGSFSSATLIRLAAAAASSALGGTMATVRRGRFRAV